MAGDMKDSGVAWIGEIPSTWDTIKIRFVTSIRAEKIEYKEGDSYLGLENIDGFSGKYIPTETIYSDGIYDSYNEGDLLFSLLRPYLGKVMLAEEHGACTGELVVIKSFSGCMSFLFYCMISNRFIETVNLSTYGAKMPRANWDFIRNLFIPMPSICEQNRIATYLDSRCSEIESLSYDIQKEIETLEAYKKSLITETVTKGLDKSALMKDSGIDWIGIVSEKWSTIKIRFVTTIRTEKIEYKEEGGHYLGLENIEGFSGKFIPSETIYPAGIYDKYNKNDLLFSLLRPYLGKVMLANDFGACSGELVVIKSFSGYMPYLFYCMISNRFIETVNLSTYGAKMPRASWDFVRNMFIPVPPFQEQKAIAAFLDSKCSEIDSIIASKKKQLDTLASYKKSLIYEYVTGKKEVK